MKRTVSLLFVGCALLTAVNALPAHADDIAVTAEIPYPAPTTPAEILSPAANSETSSPQLAVSGTCENMSPAVIVSLWRQGTFIGSSPCTTTGTFSIATQLVAGTNSIIARSSSISGQYGPDSNPLVITYIPPPAPAPAPVAANEPEPTPEQAADSDLTLMTSKPFGVLKPDNSIEIEIVIEGGATPYRIVIVWGDGATLEKTVTDPGTYRFSHTYQKAGSYTIAATIRDVLGVSRIITWAVAPGAPVDGTDTNQNPSGQLQADGQDNSRSAAWWIAAGSAGAAGISLIAFLLGRYYQASYILKLRAKKPAARKRVRQ